MAPATTTPPNLAQLATKLNAIGQAHVLAFHDDLDQAQRSALLQSIAAIDLDRVAELQQHALSNDATPLATDSLAPAPYYPLDADSRAWDRDHFKQVGEQLLRAGKVAVFTVAGGQGTRLGYDGPKGCFRAGAVTGKTLFQMLAEQVLAASQRYQVTIQWRLMTSPLNHDATVAFFKQHDYFSLDPAQIAFFQQGVLPCFDDQTGRLLLADKHQVATNPDGHGGSLKALFTSASVEQLQQLGVEHLSYVQIDNPLVNALDPVFIGLHAAADDSSSEMSSKMIAKADPAERVGVFCSSNGKLQVIEYSDLPDSLANQQQPDGALRFNAGSPAIHMISLDFVRRLNSSPAGFALPLHRAHKKVECVHHETGKCGTPAEPNAVKLETFVFDALPMCDQSIVLETDRMEFAPIKNASGADSAQTSAALQTQRAAHWLESAGVTVPRKPDGSPDCTIEISPLTAMAPEHLQKIDLPAAIKPGESIAL